MGEPSTRIMKSPAGVITVALALLMIGGEAFTPHPLPARAAVSVVDGLGSSKSFHRGGSLRRPPIQMSTAEVPESEPEKGLGQKIFDAYVKTADVATTMFPLWTVLFTA